MDSYTVVRREYDISVPRNVLRGTLKWTCKTAKSKKDLSMKIKIRLFYECEGSIISRSQDHGQQATSNLLSDVKYQWPKSSQAR